MVCTFVDVRMPPRPPRQDLDMGPITALTFTSPRAGTAGKDGSADAEVRCLRGPMINHGYI